jgi:hypothetical protein
LSRLQSANNKLVPIHASKLMYKKGTCTKSDMSITVIYHAVSLTVLYVCIKHVHIIDILPLGGFEHCLTIDNSEDIVILLDL